jgi:hypothetical protein
MAYHTLLVFEDGAWAPQFGDRDRDIVVQEIRDMIDSGSDNPRHRRFYCIRKTPQAPSHAAVMAIAATLPHPKP